MFFWRFLGRGWSQRRIHLAASAERLPRKARPGWRRLRPSCPAGWSRWRRQVFPDRSDSPLRTLAAGDTADLSGRRVFPRTPIRGDPRRMRVHQRALEAGDRADCRRYSQADHRPWAGQIVATVRFISLTSETSAGSRARDEMPNTDATSCSDGNGRSQTQRIPHRAPLARLAGWPHERRPRQVARPFVNTTTPVTSLREP
jgi:hypothetical protein